jgi:hypothetical protein
MSWNYGNNNDDDDDDDDDDDPFLDPKKQLDS